MSNPAIVAVDDDPQVVRAVRRDLQVKYGSDYRVLSAGSGAEALETLAELRSRGDTVALFLIDQRMPGLTGTEFLLQAIPTFPDAKRLLLTAYADTEAAIQAINEVGLDHYLLKPWEPPEEHLYPIIDDMLADWKATVRAPFQGIRVAGTTWSPATHEIKDFLARNQIPYRFLDIERDEDAADLVATATGGEGTIPVVFFPEGEPMVRPERRALAERVGLHTEPGNPFYDVIIIGGGPAGLAGAVYGASEGLRTLMIERDAPGGQAGTSSRIENYLGFPAGIAGGDLARRALTQATRLGAEILTAVEVTGVRVEDNVKVVTLADGAELTSHAIVISSGMTVRKLDVPGYEEFEGAGVYYGAAPSEAATYRGGHVFVVGGGNSAGQAAMMFSRYAAQVTLLVRSESLSAYMSQYLIDQIGEQENIDVLTNVEVLAVEGERQPERLRLRDLASGEERVMEASAVFIFVGQVPHTDFVTDVVRCDDQGFIYTGLDIFLGGERPPTWKVDRDPFPMETSVPGIFAAGDVRHGVIRRVASAVGQGSITISMVHKYLETV